MTARQACAAFAEKSFIALWQFSDKRIRLRRASSGFDLRVTRVWPAVANVLPGRGTEYHGFLWNKTNPRAQLARVGKGDIDAVADTLLRLSALIDDLPEVMEIDLNPVKVAQPGDGVRIVDARIKVRRVGMRWIPSRTDLPMRL